MNSVPRVLFVDDDATIRDLVDEVLTGAGYEVRALTTGDEALATLPTWRPDVVVLESRTPSLDAEAFLAACRRHKTWGTPVILLSGASDIDRHAARLGADGALSKPFNIDALCEVVSRFAGGLPQAV